MAVTLSPGADIRQRDLLRSLIAGSAAFTDWTALVELADRLERITSPDYSGTGQLPAVVISNGESSRRLNSSSGGSERQAVIGSGELAVLVFDALDAEADFEAEEKRFAGNLAALADELAVDASLAGWGSGMRISEVYLPADAWHRTNVVTEQDLDEDEATVEADDLFSGPVWIGKMFVRWGPFQ